ncbi:hypothetical protein KJA13_00690 [Patescibacteria group bacterium]|nr:hypothetical protein [Patescibacteria group bacterium]
MYKLLYLVRAEADFERVVALAIAGKDKFKQTFIFTGSLPPFFVNEIQNQFQKHLFKKHGFKIKDLCDYDIIGIILKKFSYKEKFSIADEIFKSRKKLFKFLVPLAFLYLLRQYKELRKRKITKKILKEVNPDALLTDASQPMPDYVPEVFRKAAFEMGIPSCIFPHGAAGGLHQAFSEPKCHNYKNYYVFVCSDLDIKTISADRIILGDMSSSFPYVNYLHSINSHTLSFLNDRKFKIAFLQSGVIGYYTSTNAWLEMEKIIINLSNNPDVAMIIKKHPRKSDTITDFRMFSTFNNVKIVGSECDRSRVVKWADIIVCSDHCSTIFEPMILGKKVVAIEGTHIPKYKDKHSPLKNSSVKYISSAEEFDFNSIPNANPEDPVTNRICWGNHGKVDLARLFLEKVEEIIMNRR